MVNVDRHIAVQAGWVAGPAFAAAMMAAPEYLHLGPVLSAVIFWVGIAVFLLTIFVVSLVSLHAQDARKRVTGPIITMAVGALILCAGMAWYFWPRGQPEAKTPHANPSAKAEPRSFIRENIIVDTNSIIVGGVAEDNLQAGRINIIQADQARRNVQLGPSGRKTKPVLTIETRHWIGGGVDLVNPGVSFAIELRINNVAARKVKIVSWATAIKMSDGAVYDGELTIPADEGLTFSAGENNETKIFLKPEDSILVKTEGKIFAPNESVSGWLTVMFKQLSQDKLIGANGTVVMSVREAAGNVITRSLAIPTISPPAESARK